MTCPKGYISEKMATECDKCRGGTDTIDLEVCLQCNPGKFSPDGLLCNDCPMNWKDNEMNRSHCESCKIGWSTNEMVGSLKCYIVPMNEEIEPPKIVSLQPMHGFRGLDMKPLVLFLEFTASQLEDDNLVFIMAEWWTHESNLEVDKLPWEHNDYEFKKIDKPKLPLVNENTERRRTVTTSTDETIMYRYNFTLGVYPLWSKPIHVRTTYVLKSGGTGRMTSINMASPVKNDCEDKGGVQWYLRTHPHDNTCSDPIDLLGGNRTDKIRCIQCPLGGSCNKQVIKSDQIGMLLWDVAPRQGWWRIPWAAKRGDLRNERNDLIEAPMFFAKCPRKDSCIGVSETAFFNYSGWWDIDSNSNVIGLDIVQNWTCPMPHPTSSCRRGTEGALCAVCSNDYTRRNGVCVKCSSVEARVAVGIALLVPLLFVMGWLRRNLKRLSAPVRNSLRDINRVAQIFISMAQILSSLSYSINVPWPENLIDFLALFDILNIDIASITGATCNNKINFPVQFSVMAVCPLIICALSIMTYINGQDKISEDLHALRKAHNRDILARELSDCYVDLFRIVDIDHSGSIDKHELVDLLKLVGFKSPHINEKLATLLIQRMTSSINVSSLTMGVFLHEIKSGNLYSLVNLTLSDIQKDSNITGEVEARKVALAKIYPKETKNNKSILHEEESESLLVWNRTRKLISYSFSWAMQLLLVLHTPVSRKVFQYFDCRQVGTEGFSKSFLRVDYSVQCRDGDVQVDSYTAFLPVVILVFGGFTLLLPIGLALYLVCHRNSLYAPNTLLRMGWLYERLNHGSEFWEIHELIRKMTLTGLIIFFPPDPAVRSCLALLVCIISQCSLSYFKPHRNRLIFWAEESAFAVVLLIYVCAVVLQAKMSEEDNGKVGRGMIAIVCVCTVWISSVLLWSMITFCKKWRNKDHLTESVLAEQEHKRKTLDKEYNFKRIVGSLKKKKNSFNARKIALDHNDSVDKRKQQLGNQQNNASNRLKMRKSKRLDNSAAIHANNMLCIHSLFHLIDKNSGGTVSKEAFILSTTIRRKNEPQLDRAFKALVERFPKAMKLLRPESSQAAIYAMDTNNDNLLTEDEMLHYCVECIRNNMPKTEAIESVVNKQFKDMKFIRQMFQAIDTDADGQVTKVEFINAIMNRYVDDALDNTFIAFVKRFPKGYAEHLLKPGSMKATLASIDSNDDNVVTVKELHQYVEGLVKTK